MPCGPLKINLEYYILDIMPRGPLKINLEYFILDIMPCGPLKIDLEYCFLGYNGILVVLSQTNAKEFF
jgi:hypothetical protein